MKLVNDWYYLFRVEKFVKSLNGERLGRIKGSLLYCKKVEGTLKKGRGYFIENDNGEKVKMEGRMMKEILKDKRVRNELEEKQGGLF
jgi:hypothetical protein